MADIVTLSNGAQARRLPNGQLRFVKGASADYLATIRTPKGTKRGPNTKPSSKPVGMQYLLAKLKADKGYNGRAVRSDVHRAKLSTRTLDPSNKRDARLIRKEGSLNRYDVAGTLTIRPRDGPQRKEAVNLDHGVALTQKHPYGKTGLRMRVPKKHPVHMYPVAPRSAAQTAASKRNILAALAARRGQTAGYW